MGKFSMGIWKDVPPPESFLYIENDTAVYFFIKYDERKKDVMEPTIFQEGDDITMIFAPDEHRPIVYEKNIRRIIPDNPMHKEAIFNEVFRRKTEGRPLAIPEEASAYWSSINARLDSIGDGDLAEAVPEIAIVDKAGHDEKAEPLSAIVLPQARHAHLKAGKLIDQETQMAVLPGYRNSLVDAVTTAELYRELTIFREGILAAMENGFSAIGVMQEHLPHPELFARFPDKITEFLEVIDGKRIWSTKYDAFLYGLQNTFRGWMYEAAKDAVVPGGLLVSPGHYRVECAIYSQVLENPSLESLLSKRPKDPPTKWFTDQGYFPALDVTVYGRKEVV